MSDKREVNPDEGSEEQSRDLDRSTDLPTDRDEREGSSDALEDKVVELYLRTGSPTYIVKTLGVPKWKIYDILKKRGIKPLRSRAQGGGEGYPTARPTGDQDSLVVIEPPGGGSEPPDPMVRREASTIMRTPEGLAAVTEREIVAFATPVLRKVILNPKILLYYDYFRSKGYSGDLGDFINECIELLFKLKGYQIVIERRSEVE